MCDEADRRALLDHAASQLRNWTTTALAIAIVIFTVFSEGAMGWLNSKGLFDLVLAFLLSQMTLALARVLWYERQFRETLCASPRAIGDPRSKASLREGEEETPIYRLYAGAEDLTRRDLGHVGRIIDYSGYSKGWIVSSLILTLSLYGIMYFLSHPVMWCA